MQGKEAQRGRHNPSGDATTRSCYNRDVEKRCRLFVHKYALAAGGVSILPIPMAGVAFNDHALLKLSARILQLFDLSEDQLATVVDLLCRGAAEARLVVTAGMLELPITIQVRKAMLRLKKQLGLANMEIGGEFELLDLSSDEPEVLGRIDIILRFLHQFGDEEAYLGVECKRVAHGAATLNQRYVTQGVNRFVIGQYATGHHWGMMLGYVLKLPSAALIAGIDFRIRATYGDSAKLDVTDAHADS